MDFAGGYDLLGRTKDQIKSSQQVQDAKAACEALNLDALVLVGGECSRLLLLREMDYYYALNVYICLVNGNLAFFVPGWNLLCIRLIHSYCYYKEFSF